eukprot:TRINITY_DN40229_c0_g1_i1.p1 TRINITY_DN40229_c0_g1~~TRINITY_DN40229_c0_g1_i1.p1  ORF type:complete len:259 (-),score=44.37 TRINITY_DN40229_c0_g1_i1:207-983(-)
MLFKVSWEGSGKLASRTVNDDYMLWRWLPPNVKTVPAPEEFSTEAPKFQSGAINLGTCPPGPEGEWLVKTFKRLAKMNTWKACFLGPPSWKKASNQVDTQQQQFVSDLQAAFDQDFHDLGEKIHEVRLTVLTSSARPVEKKDQTRGYIRKGIRYDGYRVSRLAVNIPARVDRCFYPPKRIPEAEFCFPLQEMQEQDEAAGNVYALQIDQQWRFTQYEPIPVQGELDKPVGPCSWECELAILRVRMDTAKDLKVGMNFN